MLNFTNHTEKERFNIDDSHQIEQQAHEIVLDSIDGAVKSSEVQSKASNVNESSITCDTHDPCRHGTCFMNGTEIACKCDLGKSIKPKSFHWDGYDAPLGCYSA